MQLLLLHENPRRAAFKLRTRAHPGKLFVEACQIAGQALRNHGCDDARLYRAPTKSHPCILWAASGRDAFQWVVEHAAALHHVFDKCCRKKRPLQGTHDTVFKPHASLAALEYLQELIATNNLPESLPEHSDPDTFYAECNRVRSKQSPSAQKKRGAVLIASSGLPEGIATAAIAIDGMHQEFCIVKNDGGIDAVRSYQKYHEARFPVRTLNAEWLDESV